MNLSSPPPGRILPSSSDSFLLKNLVSGADYSLCVLAIFDDTITALAATRVLGCAQFSTMESYPECLSLKAHFLGGTLTVLVGGVVVVTLLSFTVALMVRHRVCGNRGDRGRSRRCRGDGAPPPKGGVSRVCQSNGNGDMMMVVLPNGLSAKQREGGDKEGGASPHKPKPLPKPKVDVEHFLSVGGAVGGGGGVTTLDLCERNRKLPPYSPQPDRLSEYYSNSSTLPRQSREIGRASGRERV